MTAQARMDKQTLDLPLLLPDVPDARDHCVERLTNSLQDRDGIERAHVLPEEEGMRARLCVHYESEVMPLPRIRNIARSIGADLTDQFGHLVAEVEGVRHPRHARTMTEQIRRVEGVVEAEVSASGQVRVEFDRSVLDDEQVRERLRNLGLGVHGQAREREREAEPARRDETADEKCGRDGGALRGLRTELVFSILAGVCVAAGFGLSFAPAASAWLSLGFYLASYALGGYYTAREAIDSARVGRFEVDLLMLVAAIGAAVLGRWAEGGFLLFLFSLGHALEHYAMDRAHEAIESLSDLAPPTARVRRDRAEVEIPVEEVARGDTVIVRPNERIPADGFVVKGESEVNQAPVTGESVPVEKRPVDDPDRIASDEEGVPSAHRLFAGTINGNGALEMRVTRHSGETTLARVVEMVTEAEAEKSPTQRFTDRFERYFVPAVLGLVVLLLFAWIPLGEPFSESFYRAMAVLVAASPCALAIATPSAVLSGVARAARGGVLVKGGGPLENLGTIEALAFDKTGTLTEGTPRVTDVWAMDGVSENELLRTAVAVEQLSDHPLAEAVVSYGRERLDGARIGTAENLESLTGRGVRARVDGQFVRIGNETLFDGANGLPLPDPVGETVSDLERQGCTTMIVKRGERYLGVIGLMDAARDGAGTVIEKLRGLGIRRTVMISGDNQRVADAVGRSLGIDEARGGLLPDEKVDTIRSLREEGPVGMVGDGVNDAPAMASATVGIAMGAAGSDAALETSDVALMADRLDHLPFAVGLSRQTSRVIRQNLWIALGTIGLLVPATLFGLNIGPAVVLHEGSTLLVVANSLRLLGYASE